MARKRNARSRRAQGQRALSGNGFHAPYNDKDQKKMLGEEIDVEEDNLMDVEEDKDERQLFFFIILNLF